MWKKILIIIVVLCLVGVGFTIWKGKNAVSTQNNLIQVKAIVATPENISTQVSADGIVQAKHTTEIKATMSGLVKERLVVVGQDVTKGSSVLKLDNEVLEKNLETVRFALIEAEQSYDKLLKNYAQQDEQNKLKLTEAQDNVLIAELSLNQEKVSLDSKKINAEKSVQDAQDALEKAITELNNKKYLYEKNAIARKELESAEDAHRKAEEAYQIAETNLQTLLQETIPASLQLAELKVKNAKNQLELLNSTIEKGGITAKEIEVASFKVKNAKNAVRDAEAEIDKLVIYTPMTGTIVNWPLKNGDKILEGTTIGQVADLNQLIIEAWVDEIHINQIAVGQNVTVYSEAFDTRLTGQLANIAPVAEKQGNVSKFKVEVELADAQGLLRPGMVVDCDIRTNYKENVIAVPPLVVQGTGERYVLVVKDGIAQKRIVQLGLQNLSKVEITGVEAGEQIIIGPFPILRNLMPDTPVVVDAPMQK